MSKEVSGKTEAEAVLKESLIPDEDLQEADVTNSKDDSKEVVTNTYLTNPTLSNAASTSGAVTFNDEGASNADSETRLWIGNLDARLREYHLLKMVQRYGPIDNFDFLFHRTGPNIGLPRGYAFVTFVDKEDAEKCLKSLDGTKVLEKPVAVRWAHQATTTFIDEETKLKSKLPALSMKKEETSETPTTSSLTKERAILAIEAKLKAMEKEKEQGSNAGSSSSFFYQYNKELPAPTMKQRPRPYDRSRHQNRRPPRRR